MGDHLQPRKHVPLARLNLLAVCWSMQEPTLSAQDKAFKNERGGGNYGAGTRALQEQNFMARQKRETLRKQMFEEALEKFRANDIEQVGAAFDPGAPCSSSHTATAFG